MRRCARWPILVGEPMVVSDYLFSNVRMFMSRTVELLDRFQQIEASMKRLSDGATDVRSSLSDTRYVRVRIICSISSTVTRLLDEATALDQLARELLGKVSDVISSLDSTLLDTCLVSCRFLITAQVRSLMSRLCYQVRMISLFRRTLSNGFCRAPPDGYINQENGFIYHRVEGISERAACCPFSC